MGERTSVEITEFTDPVCTWCWGSEPMLRALETRYDGRIEVRFVMGGLVEDIRAFRDSANDIGGDMSRVNAQVARHWLEASARHGMPVKADGFALFSEEYPSTYPANVAVKAAQLQSEELSKKLLRRIREAAASETRNVNEEAVLIELAQESGLDVSKFIRSLSDGSAEGAFRDDLQLTRSRGVRGFPTFEVKASNGKAVLLRGYQSYETFKDVIGQITGGQVVERAPEQTEGAVLSFLRRYGRVAPIEIEASLSLSSAKADAIVEGLRAQRLVTVTSAGNGRFIEASADSPSCDSTTGVCRVDP